MPTSLPSNCQSDKSVSMLMLNGTDDPIVHYQGGLVGGQGILGKLISVPGTIEFWRKYNKFPPAHLDSSLNPQTQILRYFDSQTGAEVILVTIKGGKHSWPGGFYERKKPKLGNVNISGISASQYIWNFFKRHTSP